MSLDRTYLRWLCASLLLGAFLSLACTGQPINIFTTQTATQGGQTQPGASPSPGSGEAGFDSIRVGIYGHDAGCKNPPRNGEAVVRLNCSAFVTATPKKGEVEVPPAVHGPTIDWYLNGQLVVGIGGNAVVAVTVESNPFNLVVRGLAPGAFTLEAAVKGVRSGPKGFTVAASGALSEAEKMDGTPMPACSPESSGPCGCVPCTGGGGGGGW